MALLGRFKGILAGAGLTATDNGDGISTFNVVASEIDHGGLGGLADDDHPQYHNNTRGDLRYWPLSTDLATQAELDAAILVVSPATATRAWMPLTTVTAGVPELVWSGADALIPTLSIL